MRPIPEEVKRQILGLWLNATTVRQISIETKVSTGEISNIINAYREGIPDLDQLRKLHLALGDADVRLLDAVRGVEFLRNLDELGFDSTYLTGCLDFIRKAGERAPELAYAAGRLIELETKSGKPYDQLLLELSAQSKAQAELSAKIKSLESRELQLKPSIRHLEQLNTLQETIDKHNITPNILDTLIRDGLRLQALGFTAQHAETLAKELTQTGLDAATASAQIARLLRECSDLEGAREKAEAEAEIWQLELGKVRTETASLQAECTRVRNQLVKLEETHHERRELLEKEYQALESKLQTEHAALKHQLEAALLARKREIETEVQDLQNKAGQLTIDIDKLESAKANMSDAEAQLQRIEQSIARSRILATAALLIENPGSLGTPGKVVETMIALSEGFRTYLDETGLASWKNRLTLKEAAERLSKALAEEATR